MRRTPTLTPGGSAASKPMSTFSLQPADSVRMALRNWPAVYLKWATVPPTGAFCTCTSSTDRNIDMRRHSPPMNCGSETVSITSTLPWPGETTSLAPAGTRGLGSRKK